MTVLLTHKSLCPVEGLLIDDGRVGAFSVILLPLPAVLHLLVREAFSGNTFLPQGVSCVFFVLEDPGHTLVRPLDLP